MEPWFGASGSSADAPAKIAAQGSRMRRGPNHELRKTTKQPLNIMPMFNAVGSQDASSKPKPMAPRKSGSPTLSSRPFSVAIPAPKKTPAIPSHGLMTSLDALPVSGAAGAAVPGGGVPA